MVGLVWAPGFEDVMALYSVWNWNSNSYRVYETTRSVSVGDDPRPPRPHNTSVIGANPDTDVKPLPAGARFIGNSHVPRGEIRRLANGLGDNGDDAGVNGVSGWLTFVLGTGVGATALWWWNRRRR